MFKSKRIVLTSLVVLFIGILCITTSNFLNTRGVKANQSQTQQTTNTTQDNHFKRQPESDSVSGKQTIHILTGLLILQEKNIQL